MARVQVEAQSLAGGQKDGLTEIEWGASDSSNFEQTVWTDGLIICWHNSSADTPYEATLEAAPDRLGRDVDVVKELADGEYWCTKEIPDEGFRQSDGQVYFKGANAALLYAVLKVK